MTAALRTSGRTVQTLWEIMWVSHRGSVLIVSGDGDGAGDGVYSPGTGDGGGDGPVYCHGDDDGGVY